MVAHATAYRHHSLVIKTFFVHFLLGLPRVSARDSLANLSTVRSWGPRYLCSILVSTYAAARCFCTLSGRPLLCPGGRA